MSKFIIRLLRHSQIKFLEKQMEESHYDQVIDACKRKQSDSTGYWSDEMKKHSVNAPNWSILQMDISSGKKWRTEKKVPILLESELSSSILVPSSNPKDIQEVQSILHCKTMYCYQKILPSFFHHVGNGKELRFNSEFMV